MSKDIKDYLHLYLGCEVATTFNDFKYTLIGVEKNSRMLGVIIWRKATGRTVKVSAEIKPILRPLSDMTEDEDCEYRDVYQSMPSLPWDSYARHSAAITLFLLSKHFDLFGLIEAGLAIDKTKQAA